MLMMSDTGLAIFNAARGFQLDPRLIAAVIMKESSGNQWATRYEDAFFTRYVADKTRTTLQGFVPPEGQVSIATEKRARAMSWGLMQVMGQVAREQGFEGLFLSELSDPKVGIHYGCKKLRQCLDWSPTLIKAVNRYNGGGNAAYARTVLKIMDSGEADHLRI